MVLKKSIIFSDNNNNNVLQGLQSLLINALSLRESFTCVFVVYLEFPSLFHRLVVAVCGPAWASSLVIGCKSAGFSVSLLEAEAWVCIFGCGSPLSVTVALAANELPVMQENMATNCSRTSLCQMAYTIGLISELESPSSHIWFSITALRAQLLQRMCTMDTTKKGHQRTKKQPTSTATVLRALTWLQ